MGPGQGQQLGQAEAEVATPRLVLLQFYSYCKTVGARSGGCSWAQESSQKAIDHNNSEYLELCSSNSLCSHSQRYLACTAATQKSSGNPAPSDSPPRLSIAPRPTPPGFLDRSPPPLDHPETGRGWRRWIERGCRFCSHRLWHQIWTRLSIWACRFLRRGLPASCWDIIGEAQW